MQGPLHYELHTVDVIKSTNTTLKAWAKDGAKEGTVLVAHAQTNGRGRLNRVFFSPKGTGLYVSILLRPTVALPPSALTCMSAVAVADTIESFGVPAAVKWVNDVYVDGKKAVGILAEGSMKPDGRYDYAVVGIGVNLFAPEGGFPESIRDTATAVFSGAQNPTLREAFLERLLSEFRRFYEALPELPFADAYRRRQLIFGRSILFQSQGRMLRGTATGIDDAFRLLVTDADGQTYALDRGDVTIL